MKEQYDTELAKLPVEFQRYLSYESYDRRDSAGEDECISIALGMISALLPIVQTYTTRILNDAHRATNIQRP